MSRAGVLQELERHETGAGDERVRTEGLLPESKIAFVRCGRVLTEDVADVRGVIVGRPWERVTGGGRDFLGTEGGPAVVLHGLGDLRPEPFGNGVATDRTGRGAESAGLAAISRPELRHQKLAVLGADVLHSVTQVAVERFAVLGVLRGIVAGG
jgi:hypothetical protein